MPCFMFSMLNPFKYSTFMVNDFFEFTLVNPLVPYQAGTFFVLLEDQWKTFPSTFQVLCWFLLVYKFWWTCIIIDEWLYICSNTFHAEYFKLEKEPISVVYQEGISLHLESNYLGSLQWHIQYGTRHCNSIGWGRRELV